MGAKAKAKANAAIAIPELIQNAANPTYEENRKDKHNKNARNGWYRYDVPVRYNIFKARLLINHAANNKKYLYDVLAIKKRNEHPFPV